MNELKELFQELVEAPPPARSTSAEVLAAARRARRWSRTTATAWVLAGIAVAAAAGLILPAVVTGGSAPPPPAATRSAEPTRAPSPPVPGEDALMEHSPQVAELLAEALGPGLSLAVGADPGWDVMHLTRGGDQVYWSLAWVSVAADDSPVVLSAAVVADGEPPPSDPCTPEVAARLDWFTGAAATGCQVIVVDSVPVRVTTEEDPTLGPVWRAVRFLDGGFLAIQLTPGSPHDGWVPDPADPWTWEAEPDRTRWLVPPLSRRELAALAADPGLLP